MTSRRLLFIDFSCGLMVGLIYYIYFDLLSETLGLPLWIAYSQLAANSLYGVFGLFLFVTNRERLLGLVAKMNIVYAIACFVLVPYLLWIEVKYGAVLLMAEGIFILVLARIELKINLTKKMT